MLMQHKQDFGDYIHHTAARYGENITPQHMAYIADLCEDYNEICEFLEVHPAPVGIDMAGVSGNGDGGEIAEELQGAEKYYRAWQSTGDATYQAMAGDELRHAKTLMDKSAGKVAADKLQHFHALHDQLAARLAGVHAMAR